MSRRPARERPSAAFDALSPVYWKLGPLLGLLPILLMIGLFATLAANGNSETPWPGIAFLASIALGTGLMFAGSKVVLAEGGLWIRHYGGLIKRFIPYKDIALVDTIERLGKPPRGRYDSFTNNQFVVFHAVRITLRKGERVLIGTSSEEAEISGKTSFSIGEYGHYGGANASARLLVGEIRARIQAEDARPEPSPVAAELMRGDRSVEEWCAALGRRTPDVAEAYRGDATETLWRVIEDEQAPRDARAGAAIALRKQLDADGRARLRVVASDCEPKLRVALDAALDDEAEEKDVLSALARASDRTE